MNNHQLELLYIPMLGGSASPELWFRHGCLSMSVNMQAIHAYTNLSPSAKESSNMWPLLTLDLNLSSLNHLADALAEAQEKVHGVEHIHLSKLTKKLLVAEPRITFW